MHVVLGEQRYRVDRFWGSLPENMRLGQVSTVAVASDGAVLIAQRNGPAVVVLESDGSFRHVWGESGVADPHGINVDGADRALLVDRDAHQILIRRVDGTPLATLGSRHRPRFQAPFNHPTSAFATADGEIYVADGYGNSCVHRFAADGQHLTTWGRPGSGTGEFSTPHSVWVDRRDRVLVADRENDRVQVFSRDGDHLATWSGFYHPMDLCEDPLGHIYVTDQIPRLSMLTADGELVGRCRPVWNTPHGIACDGDGVFYLTEMSPSSITRLMPVTN